MPRIMKNGNQKITVHGHAILRNGWEYYFIDDKHRSDIRDALVIGFENEIGSVSQKEINPYMISYAFGDDLNGIMPAPEWEWA